MKVFSTVILIFSLGVTTSCTSLNSTQSRELAEWKSQNLKVEEKNEALAAGLNVLPGIGDFYNGNIGLGVVNLLSWPVSVLWAPIGGASGAAETNYYSTKTHVENLTKKKQALITDLQSAAMMKQITSEEYYIATEKIKNMNLSEFKDGKSISDFVPKIYQDHTRIPSSMNK